MNTPDKEKMIDFICEEVNIPRNKLFDRNRKKEVVLARQLTMWFFEVHFGVGRVEIGRYFERDHGTVYHNINTINGLLEVREDEVCNIISSIEEKYLNTQSQL